MANRRSGAGPTALVLALACGLGAGAGCSLGPKHFKGLSDSAPLNRARAVGLGQNLPDSVVVPRLIDRLEDPDPVVRTSANETLRARTGQDFGFIAWSDASERAQAVAKWRDWWKRNPQSRVDPNAAARARPRNRKAGLANSRQIP